MVKNRKIVAITIGYVIGIIGGLYFTTSIILLCFILGLLLRIKYFRISKYMKLVIDFFTIFLIIISSLVASIVVKNQNNNYEKMYKNVKEICTQVVIIDNGKEYSNYIRYKVQVKENCKYKDTYLYINVNKSIKIQFGDLIYIKGQFIQPEISRNYGGFDYKEYLKTQKVYGTIKIEEIKVLKKNTNNVLLQFSNNIFLFIKSSIKKEFDEETSSVLLGVLLGDTSEIDENIRENFSNSNISHILAISGMHISYLTLGLSIVFNNIIGKRNTKFFIILFLLFYMIITGFSPSVVRATVMAIMLLISDLLHRKNDIWTSISVAMLILLIYNPFLIRSISVLYSFSATLGIIIFQKNIKSLLKSIKLRKKGHIYRPIIVFNKYIEKIISFSIDILSVSFASQIAIIPITIYYFNSVSLNFIIFNYLISLIIGPLVILGFIFIVISLTNLTHFISIKFILNFLVKALIKISSFGDYIPFSKILISTPSVYNVIFYYVLFFILNFIYISFQSKDKSTFYKRIVNYIFLFKYIARKNVKKIMVSICSILIIFIIISLIPQNLKIHFVDVGQGDCTLIKTPHNKTILIDGGGSTYYNVGEKTLLPYLLDRSVTRVDYLIISHFDTDHVDGLMEVLRELYVGKVIISKQIENSDNYERFIKIVTDKKIKVFLVNKGDKLNIEKNLYIDILWPNDNNIILENVLNNNSITCKLVYNSFSILFTGDIEEMAEKEILNKDANKLESTILKVAHHGSKTSSTKEFLEAVQPKIALIGVGNDNKFGHPNSSVIKRLDDIGAIIYRTDKMGEISITVNKKGKIKVKKYIE